MRPFAFLLLLFIACCTFAQEADPKLQRYYDLQMHYHFNGQHEQSLQYFDSIQSRTSSPKVDALNAAYLSCEELIAAGKGR